MFESRRSVKNPSKMTPFAEIQKMESDITGVYSSIITNFEQSVNRKREVPICSGSIWDWNPEENSQDKKELLPRTADGFSSKGSDIFCLDDVTGIKAVEVESKKIKALTEETEDVSGGIVNLKVFDKKGKVVGELPVLDMELLEIKESFPQIFKILTDAEVDDVVVPYSANAMIIVLKCIFGAPFTVYSWEVVLEVYAIAKKIKFQQLLKQCESYFKHNPIATEDMLKVAQLVKHLKVQEALRSTKTFKILERLSFDSSVHPFEKKSCIVSRSTYEPFEVLIPLFYSKEKDLRDFTQSDITNKMEIKSIQGFYTITGFQIKLKLHSFDKGKELKIFCDITKDNKTVLEIEKCTKLQPLIVIDFNKKLCLKSKESISVSVLIEDMVFYLCHYLKEEKLEYNNKYGKLQVDFTSDKKTGKKQMLFFIEKLFYDN